MNTLHHALAQPRALWLLAVLPVLSLLTFLAVRWRRRVSVQFGSGPNSGEKGTRWRTLRYYCVAVGLACLALGLAAPQWGKDRDQTLALGRDEIVVLDLSLSMLAKDVPTAASDSRLGQAISVLRDLADVAENRGGHRLALVVFASRPKVVCPLTQDYDHFRETLAQLSPLDPLLEIGPEEGSASGTRMGRALQEGIRLARESPSPGYQDILMLSDGDDPAQDGEWQIGIAAARKDKIPVHTIGFGDPERLSPILIPGYGPLRYHGQPVMTRLQQKPLEEIALQTGGTYVPAGTRALPLADWLSAGRELRDDSFPVLKQRFAWFYGLALAFLVVPLTLPEIPRNRKTMNSDS
jgi:Ca-activated chloride channel homolog